MDRIRGISISEISSAAPMVFGGANPIEPQAAPNRKYKSTARYIIPHQAKNVNTLMKFSAKKNENKF